MKKIAKYVCIISALAIGVMCLQSCSTSKSKYGCPERMHLDLLK